MVPKKKKKVCKMRRGHRGQALKKNKALNLLDGNPKVSRALKKIFMFTFLCLKRRFEYKIN